MITFDICHTDHSVYPPPLSAEGGLGVGGGGLSLQPNFLKGGLDRTSTFRRGCWERVGLQFSHKK